MLFGNILNLILFRNKITSRSSNIIFVFFFANQLLVAILRHYITCIIHTVVKGVITSLAVKELKPTCWLITTLTPEA